MVVEVMGRYAGWIALNSGISGTADAILIPEIPYDIAKVVAKIEEREKRGRNFSIVVVAEGARPKDGTTSVIAHEIPLQRRLFRAMSSLRDQFERGGMSMPAWGGA